MGHGHGMRILKSWEFFIWEEDIFYCFFFIAREMYIFSHQKNDIVNMLYSYSELNPQNRDFYINLVRLCLKS